MKNPKATEKLKALKRVPNPMRYGTRRLLAGDEFDAKPSDASILRVAGIAVSATKREPQSISAPPATLKQKVSATASISQPLTAAPMPEYTFQGAPTPASEPEPIDDLSALRLQAEGLGIAVDRRWGARRLQSAIEEATRAGD